MKQLSYNEGESTKQLEQTIENSMVNHIEHFKREIGKLRTGRAHTSLIENLPVRVETYNTVMALKDLATLSAPDAQLLTIQPWDPSTINDIERAIATSELNLTPRNDGSIVRLSIPQMSHERRQELVKLLHKKAEECKISLRNERKEYLNAFRDLTKSKSISEDSEKRLQVILQKITDSFVEKTNNLINAKERDILQN